MTTDIEALAGVAPGSALAAALAGRADILRLTQASQDAVLTPREPGGLSHALRAALACRMARQNADPALLAQYRGMLDHAGPPPELAPMADPAAAAPADPRLRAILRHADLLATAPKQARKEDIAALRDAGVAEADIVRLAELAAFVSYQARLLAGLRLLGAAA